MNTSNNLLTSSLHKILSCLLVLGLIAFLPVYGEEKSEKSELEKLPPHIDVMVEEIKNGSAVLLDVREQHEWDEAHLAIASLAPLSKLKEGYVPEIKDKNIKVYIHCRTGNRVNSAKPLLEKTGLKRVIILKEHFTQLKALGLAKKPPVKSDESDSSDKATN